MASQQIIKNRIKTISSTKQITKAMELVAASKLRKAQDGAYGPKLYVEQSKQLIASLAACPEAVDNAFLALPKSNVPLTVIITADRGLAGAYTANVMKVAVKHLAEYGGPQKVITVGKQGSKYMSRVAGVELQGVFAADSANTERDIVQPILSEVLDLYTTKAIGVVRVVYTSFISTIRQKVCSEVLLPVPVEPSRPSNRIFEPSSHAVMALALKKYLESTLLQCVLDSKASEQAARMLAMKSATDNATELIGDLTLMYNNARQAKITQELAEISAGAEAISA